MAGLEDYQPVVWSLLNAMTKRYAESKQGTTGRLAYRIKRTEGDEGLVSFGEMYSHFCLGGPINNKKDFFEFDAMHKRISLPASTELNALTEIEERALGQWAKSFYVVVDDKVIQVPENKYYRFDEGKIVEVMLRMPVAA